MQPNGFSIRKTCLFSMLPNGFSIRKTCLFSMLPNGFQLVNVCSLRCELFAKRTAYGCVYVSGGML